MRLPSAGFALLFPALLAGAGLSNGIVKAEFGDRGLTSLSDADGVFRFANDLFAIELNGQTYEPAPTGQSATADTVTYRYEAGPFQLEMVYELRPGWHFLSKQLLIRSGPAGKFHIDQVALFRDAVRDPVDGAYVIDRARPALGVKHYGAFLHFPQSRGLLVTAQNPFLTFEHRGRDFSLSYRPQMDWDFAWGPFTSDRGLLAPYKLSGRRQPETMLPEWHLGPNSSPPGLDESEVDAFTGLIRAFLLYKPERPVNMMVGWCVNDYQIDIATAAGRTEYKRVLDRAAELGAEHVLFAPANSEVSRREDSRDDWGWEFTLWLGMGEKIRQNQWDPSTGTIPASVREMLDYARGKNLKLMAYVYPVMGFTQNREWLVAAKGTRGNLGVHILQDWLIGALEGFAKHTGISGYSFDHTFLNQEGASQYAQWWGWRRVMETLRRDMPDIVMDGRQAYQNYGPWTWLAGSYPHPTSTDEQPESFVSFPDLSLDRVSADRERYTAFRYRNYEFAPSEIVPGFITHQTARNDDFGSMPEADHKLLPFRRRDWDYLGWRYSLLSSIAIAGWNNVLDMIPARDEAEFTNFSDADKKFFRHWIDWTRENREYLRHTRPILGQPAIGKVDGTAAMIGGKGFVFLFNPNARKLAVNVADLPGAAWTEVYPAAGRRHAGSIELEGESAMVLEAGGTPAASAAAPPRFERQLTPYDPNFTGGRVSASFTIPQRVFDQLEARRKAWPIPWTTEDYRSTWLAPHRLLLFVQLAEPDDRWAVSLKIDGRSVDLLKAYASVRANKRNFTGFYADISLLAADREHRLELVLPVGLKAGQFQGVFLENVQPE